MPSKDFDPTRALTQAEKQLLLKLPEWIAFSTAERAVNRIRERAGIVPLFVGAVRRYASSVEYRTKADRPKRAPLPNTQTDKQLREKLESQRKRPHRKRLRVGPVGGVTLPATKYL